MADQPLLGRPHRWLRLQPGAVIEPQTQAHRVTARIVLADDERHPVLPGPGEAGDTVVALLPRRLVVPRELGHQRPVCVAVPRAVVLVPGDVHGSTVRTFGGVGKGVRA
jgi:hypothetical protein